VHLRFAGNRCNDKKPMQMMAVSFFLLCRVTAFCTHRAAHGRSPDERAGYAIGEKAGMNAPAGTKLPNPAESNMMAQEYFKREGTGDQQNWDLGFENGYEAGFNKAHRQ
jgi:hypothetical protein